MIETQRLINEIKQLTEERDRLRKLLDQCSLYASGRDLAGNYLAGAIDEALTKQDKRILG